MTTDHRDLALIVGVGPTTGTRVCRLLADDHTVVMVARSTERITALAEELPSAHAFACDVADRDRYAETLTRIRDEIGVPSKILINTESAAWGDYDQLSLDRFATSFDVNAVALLQLVQTLFPTTDDIAPGTRIVISSSPAAYVPPARMLGLAPSRVAQRVLAELLDENLADHGLRLAVFSIDGAIDEPKMRAMFPDRPDSFFLSPDAIAESIVSVFESEDFDPRPEISGESSFARRAAE